MCKAIDDPKAGNETFAKLYGAASVYYNYSGTATCFNLAYSPDPHGLNMWGWQVPEYFSFSFYFTFFFLFWD